MLSREAVESALALSQRFDAKRLFLEAREGSPLARLISATRVIPTEVAITNTAGGYDINADGLNARCNVVDPISHTNLHDQCQDELVELEVKTLQAHLMVARTLVGPAVDQLTRDVMVSMKNLPDSELLGMNVKMLAECSLVKNASFLSMIEKYRGIAVESPALAMRLPDLDIEQIIDLLSTGIQSVDGEIRMWVKMQDAGYIQSLFTGLFQLKEDVFADFSSAMYDRERGTDAAIFAFLGGRKLAEEVSIEGIEMSREKLQALAVEYRDQGAARLCILVNARERDMRAGNLVVSTRGGEVTVNESVYRQWISSGGSNEILYGMLLRETPIFSVHELEEKKEDLKKSWAGHMALQTRADSLTRFNATKAILNAQFRASLEVQRDVDTGPDLNATNRALVLERFDREMESVCIADLEDLPMLCLRLVCRSRFPTTDAESFLTNMVVIKKQNPELTVAEVATFATVDYLADHIASQIVVSK